MDASMPKGPRARFRRAPLPRTLVCCQIFPTRTDCIYRGQITRMDFLKSRRARRLKLCTGQSLRFLCAHSRVDAHGHHVGRGHRHSVRHSDAADGCCTSTTPTATTQSLEPYMKQFCIGDDIVHGHNLLVNDIIFNDYVFHVCGGQTLNAKITVETEEMVGCQESTRAFTAGAARQED